MSDDPRVAKAEAKAAKAHAKELRPWFKKKRWWLVGGLAVLVIGGVAAGGGNSGNQTAGSSGGGGGSGSGSNSATTISQGLGSKDATGDISELNCGSPDVLGFRTPSVRVTNNSEKTSTYFITIVSESADGSQRFDESSIIVNDLNPGQTKVADGLPFTEEAPPGSICRVSEVQRTAS